MPASNKNPRLNLSLAEEFIEEYGASVEPTSLESSVLAFVRSAKQSQSGAVVLFLNSQIDGRKIFALVKKRLKSTVRSRRAARDSSGETLEEFAKQALASARASKTGSWHGVATFISHVWKGMRSGYTLGAFKKRLFEAHQAGLLVLSRADLVEAMNSSDVKESEIPVGTYSFHFVRL